MCVRRLLARSGAATLVAWAVAAAFASTAFAGGTFHRDHTLLPAQLRSPSTPAAAHVTGAGSTLARTIVGLAIVLAVVFAIYWLLKTFAKGKSAGGKGDGRMEIVATTPLAANRALHLVRVGDGLILVGSSEGGVTRVRAYSSEESDLLQAQLDGDDDRIWPVAAAPGSGFGSFKSGFVAELRRRTARK